METIENRVDGFENVFLRTTTTRIFQMFVLHIIVLRASNVISYIISMQKLVYREDVDADEQTYYIRWQKYGPILDMYAL